MSEDDRCDIDISDGAFLPEGYRYGAVVPFKRYIGRHVIRDRDGSVCVARLVPGGAVDLAPAELDAAIGHAAARGYGADRRTESELPADDTSNDSF